MANPNTYQFNLPATGRPDDVLINEVWYPGVREYWPRCTTGRIYDPIFGIKAVVIHATAGASSEDAVSVMRDEDASFHWLVPDEDEPQHGKTVWACVPEARAAWHVRNACHHPDVNSDKTQVNHWSLGIEVVNSQLRADAFSDWQLEATAQLVRYCWAKYPNLTHIVSHAKLDPTRRSDPGTAFPWQRFKDLVLGMGPDSRVTELVANARPASAIDTRPSAGLSNCCLG
ncbi:MAG: putative N-acetylmuramoyl-L-alanine amidase [Hymenobacter sp.]|nr:putative N-acetylmuramoyl-L-alanine amidase [Hymenobacter sp.]